MSNSVILFAVAVIIAGEFGTFYIYDLLCIVFGRRIRHDNNQLWVAEFTMRVVLTIFVITGSYLVGLPLCTLLLLLLFSGFSCLVAALRIKW